MPDRATYLGRKAAGICVHCGHTDAEPHALSCAPCAQAQRAYTWAYYHRRARGEAVTDADYAPRPYRSRREHGQSAA